MIPQCGTDHLLDTWVSTPSVETSSLVCAPGNNILDCGIPHVSDREHDGITGARDHAEILGKCKNWPVVANSTEIGVKRIRQSAIIYELSAHDDILARLIGRRSAVLMEIIRLSRFREKPIRVRLLWNNKQFLLWNTNVSTKPERDWHDERTHNKVVVFGIILLCLKHNLVREDRSRCVALPNDVLRIVARRNPFGANVSVDAHRVCLAIRRIDLHSKV